MLMTNLKKKFFFLKYHILSYKSVLIYLRKVISIDYLVSVVFL